MRPAAAALSLLCLALPPAQAEIRVLPWALVAPRLDGVMDFEEFPRRPEPGINLDAPIRVPGATLGERLAGQRVVVAPGPEGNLHDLIAGHPTTPLRVRPGRHLENLSVAFHLGFASNALLPLSPPGFPALEARGEGAFAIVFDAPQAGIAMLIHTDYPEAFASDGPRPPLVVRAWGADGAALGRLEIPLATGANPVALGPGPGTAPLAAVTVTNMDPGGIAVDEIRFARAQLLF